jgi:hypothetical protein
MSTTDIIKEPTRLSAPEFSSVINTLSSNEGYSSNVEVLDVTIYRTHVEIEIIKGFRKKISHSDFKRVVSLLDSEVVVDKAIPGTLPPSNVIFISRTDKIINLTCYYPGAVRTMKYNLETISILTPNIIISHVLKADNEDWLVSSSKFFCTDLTVGKIPKTFINDISHSDRIFLLPMSNTYSEGNMCYGNNSMPVRYKDNNLRGLDYYFSFLWDTPFNNDLGINSLSRNTNLGVGDWYNLLKMTALEGKPFPYNKLRGWTSSV